MRIRSQRYSLHGWSPEHSEIEQARVGTTDCRGVDLDRMLDPGKKKDPMWPIAGRGRR